MDGNLTDEPGPDAPDGPCRRARLLLSLAADGSTTPAQAVELAAHLAACAACRAARAIDASVAARLAQRADAPLPAWLPGFAARVAALAAGQRREARLQNRILWTAAAAALLVAVTVGVLSGPRRAGPGDVADARDAFLFHSHFAKGK